MNSALADFASLEDVNDQTSSWLERRLANIAYLRSPGTEFFGRLSQALRDTFAKTERLPAEDDMPEMVLLAASEAGLRPEDAARMQHHDVQELAISGAIADLLIHSEPSLKLLEAAACGERFLDISFVAEQVAASEAASAWSSFLRKLQLTTETINDDKYLASEHLEEWQIELKKSVPTWRDGNIAPTGMTMAALVSGLLRAVDEDEWLCFLDRLPLPSIVETLLWLVPLERHPMSLLRWIERAPLAFDTEGRRTPSYLVFILERQAVALLDRDLFRRCHRLESATVLEALDEQAPARRELAEALHGRRDGLTLLCELAARSLVNADSPEFTMPTRDLRLKLQMGLAFDYLRQFENPQKIYDQARQREGVDPARSCWGLWLAVTTAVMHREDKSSDASALLGECWKWLCSLLQAPDIGLAKRYEGHAQWTEHAAGTTLVATEDPRSSLEQAWKSLVSQRLSPSETQYSEDPWTASRFVSRIAFCSYRVATDDLAPDLWTAAMEMALSAWFSSPNRDSFGEVAYGLAHLASGQRVPGEPQRTFEHLIGLPARTEEAIEMLLENGMDPTHVLESTAAAGIDAMTYLNLVRNKQRAQIIAKSRQALAAVRAGVAPAHDGSSR